METCLLQRSVRKGESSGVSALYNQHAQDAIESMDRYEICGVIDEDGHVQHDAIMRIKGLIER